MLKETATKTQQENMQRSKRFNEAQKRAQLCGFRTIESCLDWVEGQVGIYDGKRKATKPKKD